MRKLLPSIQVLLCFCIALAPLEMLSQKQYSIRDAEDISHLFHMPPRAQLAKEKGEFYFAVINKKTGKEITWIQGNPHWDYAAEVLKLLPQLNLSLPDQEAVYKIEYHHRKSLPSDISMETFRKFDYFSWHEDDYIAHYEKQVMQSVWPFRVFKKLDDEQVLKAGRLFFNTDIKNAPDSIYPISEDSLAGSEGIAVWLNRHKPKFEGVRFYQGGCIAWRPIPVDGLSKPAWKLAISGMNSCTPMYPSRLKPTTCMQEILDASLKGKCVLSVKFDHNNDIVVNTVTSDHPLLTIHSKIILAEQGMRLNNSDKKDLLVQYGNWDINDPFLSHERFMVFEFTNCQSPISSRGECGDRQAKIENVYHSDFLNRQRQLLYPHFYSGDTQLEQALISSHIVEYFAQNSWNWPKNNTELIAYAFIDECGQLHVDSLVQMTGDRSDNTANHVSAFLNQMPRWFAAPKNTIKYFKWNMELKYAEKPIVSTTKQNIPRGKGSCGPQFNFNKEEFEKWLSSAVPFHYQNWGIEIPDSIGLRVYHNPPKEKRLEWTHTSFLPSKNFLHKFLLPTILPSMQNGELVATDTTIFFDLKPEFAAYSSVIRPLGPLPRRSETKPSANLNFNEIPEYAFGEDMWKADTQKSFQKNFKALGYELESEQDLKFHIRCTIDTFGLAYFEAMRMEQDMVSFFNTTSKSFDPEKKPKYKLPSKEQMDKVIQSCVEQWRPFYPTANKNGLVNASVIVRFTISGSLKNPGQCIVSSIKLLKGTNENWEGESGQSAGGVGSGNGTGNGYDFDEYDYYTDRSRPNFYADQPAVPEEGEEALKNYFQNCIRTNPSLKMQYLLRKKIILEIDRKGKATITDIETNNKDLRSLCKDLPAFTPAIENGKPVPVFIEFYLIP